MVRRFQTAYQTWRRSRIAGKTQSAKMRAFLERSQPNDHALVNDCEFLALDIETTGLSVKHDAVLSIAYVPIIQQRVQLSAARHMLVKGDVRVGQSATIHGIHDHDIENQGMELGDIMASLLDDLAGKVLLVHYAKLDCGMLNKICNDLYGVPLVCPIVDTLAVEYQHYKRLNADDIPPLQLDACRGRYGLPRYASHNALVDAIATAELWLAQSAYRQGDQPLSLGFFR